MRYGVIPEGIKERLALFAGMAPTPALDTFMGMATARAISSAIRLGIFDALAERPSTSGDLADRLDLKRDGATTLLTTLWSLGYVEPRGSVYRLTGLAERFLVRKSPDSVATYSGDLNLDMWEWLERIEDVMRDGTPVEIHEAAAGDPFWERYMRALFEIARYGADEVAIRLNLPQNTHRMLDLAGGHGAYSCALVKRYPKLQSTIFELEGAARIGEQLVAEAGFSSRIKYRTGDLLTDDYGQGYDLACVFHILHHFTPDRCVKVLRRARAALGKGGRVAVLEQVLPSDGRKPTQLGALTGLLFFVTSGARTYSSEEIVRWLHETGYTQPRSHDLARFPGMALITARA